MVEIYDDRVSIVSPGGVPKGITKENFELAIKLSKREEILKYIKYKFEEEKKDDWL